MEGLYKTYYEIFTDYYKGDIDIDSYYQRIPVEWYKNYLHKVISCIFKHKNLVLAKFVIDLLPEQDLFEFKLKASLSRNQDIQNLFFIKPDKVIIESRFKEAVNRNPKSARSCLYNL